MGGRGAPAPITGSVFLCTVLTSPRFSIIGRCGAMITGLAVASCVGGRPRSTRTGFFSFGGGIALYLRSEVLHTLRFFPTDQSSSGANLLLATGSFREA